MFARFVYSVASRLPSAVLFSSVTIFISSILMSMASMPICFSLAIAFSVWPCSAMSCYTIFSAKKGERSKIADSRTKERANVKVTDERYVDGRVSHLEGP